MPRHQEYDDDYSDQSSNDDGAMQARPRGATIHVSPLDVSFSQWKVRHQFVCGTPLDKVVPLVRVVRCSQAEAMQHNAPWKLEAPFPTIEAVQWKCKIRDETTGRPKVDSSGAVLYDSQTRLFTVDNRRLYCLQLAAVRVWPDRCIAEVSETPTDPKERMRELRKFRTVDSGQSIMIGSTVDHVPFQRWSWRSAVGAPPEKLVGVPGAASARGRGGAGGRGGGRSHRAKGAKPAALAAATAAAAASPPVAARAGEGATLLSLLKGPPQHGSPEDCVQRAQQGATLLGMLRCGPVQAPAPLPPPPKPHSAPAGPLPSHNGHGHVGAYGGYAGGFGGGDGYTGGYTGGYAEMVGPKAGAKGGLHSGGGASGTKGKAGGKGKQKQGPR